MQIDTGHHGSTSLDGLKAAAIFRWPRAIHEGNGEAAIIVDERASASQRESLLRILSGQTPSLEQRFLAFSPQRS